MTIHRKADFAVSSPPSLQIPSHCLRCLLGSELVRQYVGVAHVCRLAGMVRREGVRHRSGWLVYVLPVAITTVTELNSVCGVKSEGAAAKIREHEQGHRQSPCGSHFGVVIELRVLSGEGAGARSGFLPISDRDHELRSHTIRHPGDFGSYVCVAINDVLRSTRSQQLHWYMGWR